jgi:hypothetical protein
MNLIKILLIILLFSSTVQAQQQDPEGPSTSQNKKLYVGIDLSNVSYTLLYNDFGKGGGVTPWITPHVGYRLTPRLNVQVGIGYNKSEFDMGGIYREDGDTELTHEHRYRTTRGWVFPVAIQFTPFNPSRRFQFYATAKFVPTVGSTKHQHAKDRAGVTTVLSEEKYSGVNTIFIGGLLLKYSISRRFDVYLEGNLLYKNFKRTSLYEAYRPKSLGLGVDYKF